MEGVSREPALALNNVSKSFRSGSEQVHAVRGIDLTIRAGEIVALLGPNGAGKTTMLDMILALTAPSGGAVRVLGASPLEAVEQGKISAVLQTSGLLPDLTVEQTVRIIAGTYAQRLDPAAVLRRCGLEHLRARRVSKCSGGEQQRLRFALALLPEPEVLVLDEPTAGMDVNARREFWSVMRNEANEGRTILFATHYLQEADEFAQRIVMLAGGEVIADGTVAEIRALAGYKHVSVTWPNAAAAELARVPAALVQQRMGDRITFEANDADEVARYLLTETTASDLEITASSLDDAFGVLTANGDDSAREN